MKLVKLLSLTCLFIAFMSYNAYSVDTNNGAELYKKCASCHGAKATGKGLGKLDENQMMRKIVEIKNADKPKWRKMKTIFITFSDADVRDISAYMMSLR